MTGATDSVLRQAEIHNMCLSAIGFVDGSVDEGKETTIPCASMDRVIQNVIGRHRDIGSLILASGLKTCLCPHEETCSGTLKTVDGFVFFVEQVFDPAVQASIFG